MAVGSASVAVQTLTQIDPGGPESASRALGSSLATSVTTTRSRPSEARLSEARCTSTGPVTSALGSAIVTVFDGAANATATVSAAAAEVIVAMASARPRTPRRAVSR